MESTIANVRFDLFHVEMVEQGVGYYFVNCQYCGFLIRTKADNLNLPLLIFK
jgi:hypothetical protein